MSGNSCHADNPFSGPLSEEMWTKAHRVTSAYEDTFDYGMYDRLYARFGDEQPRDRVVYKGTMKLLEAEDCARCFHRFEIDTYGRGCIHNRAYCYAKSYLSIRRYWNEPIPFPIDIAALRHIFATVFETSKRHKFRSILEQRVPLRIGSMSDAFMWMDQKYRVTLNSSRSSSFTSIPTSSLPAPIWWRMTPICKPWTRVWQVFRCRSPVLTRR